MLYVTLEWSLPGEKKKNCYKGRHWHNQWSLNTDFIVDTNIESVRHCLNFIVVVQKKNNLILKEWILTYWRVKGHEIFNLISVSAKGRLGGSVGWVSDFGSGHDLAVRGFEPLVRLCGYSSEPGACSGFHVSLSLPLSPLLMLCLLKMNRH